MLGFNIKDAQNYQHKLGIFIHNVEDEWGNLIRQWEQLKDCWHDRQYERFEPYFKILSERYQQSLTECNDYHVFLGGKINEMEKEPTIGERLEKGFALVQTFTSLMGGGSPPAQIVPLISPSTSYVQTILPQKDPLSSSEELEKTTSKEDIAVQEFEAKPQFMRPMELKDQLEETFVENEESKRDRLCREADILSDR